MKKLYTRHSNYLMAFVFIFWSFTIFITCGKSVASNNLPLDLPVESALDQEIRLMMEKGISLEERKRQVPIIEQAFARLTTEERARNLAALCYFKTLGTPFTPLDLAEIALVETGGHQLSSDARSYKGALGVWQLMPAQAQNHGYSPREMRDDEKCAEAAVRTLQEKLRMANGNMDRAKKLYCGVGPQADAYLIKVREVRQMLLTELDRAYSDVLADNS